MFARDRKGHTVSESAGKDERVKVFLKQCERTLVPGERTSLIGIVLGASHEPGHVAPGEGLHRAA